MRPQLRPFALFFVVALLLLLGLFFLNEKRDQFASKPVEKKVNASSVKSSTLLNQQDIKTKQEIRPYKSPDTLNRNTEINTLKNLVIEKLQQHEAHRTKLLGQSVRQSPSGIQNWYLIGIEKPSKEECAQVRKFISEVSDQADNSTRNELDEWIGDEIERYDSLGILGDRAAIIIIPDNPKETMVAYVYTTDDIGSELAKIDPKNEFDYEFSNLKTYFREDSKILQRFGQIIKK